MQLKIFKLIFFFIHLNIVFFFIFFLYCVKWFIGQSDLVHSIHYCWWHKNMIAYFTIYNFLQQLLHCIYILANSKMCLFSGYYQHRCWYNKPVYTRYFSILLLGIKLSYFWSTVCPPKYIQAYNDKYSNGLYEHTVHRPWGSRH